MSRWPPSTSPRPGGFTLLELLVAMTLLGMIATVAFGALRMGNRSWQAGLEQARRTEELRSLPAFLHRHLSQALPVEWLDGKRSRVAFDGGSDRLNFIAPAPQRRGAGLYEFSLRLEDAPDGKRLALYYRVYLPGEKRFQVDRESDRVVLLEGLQGLTIAYFGRERPREVERWRDRWSDTATRLPRLLRISLDRGETQPSWPELYIALPQAGE